MNAEIIAVGTEILMGQIVNSNAAYLSEQLANLGLMFIIMSQSGIMKSA